MIWPRRVLLNAGTWSAEQKSEYDAAWEVQKQAILGALDLQKDESNEICGQAAPNDANDTFDAYFPIAGLSAKIQYQKGLVIGLENGRDPPPPPGPRRGLGGTKRCSRRQRRIS